MLTNFVFHFSSIAAAELAIRIMSVTCPPPAVDTRIARRAALRPFTNHVLAAIRSSTISGPPMLTLSAGAACSYPSLSSAFSYLRAAWLAR